MQIIPAILENDFSEIKKKLIFLKKVKKKYNLDFDMIQIDICDGKFVKNKTWLPEILEENYEYKKNDKTLKDIYYLLKFKETSNIKIESHIMCNDQKKYFDLSSLYSESIVIHIEKYFDKFLKTDTFPKELLYLLFSSFSKKISLVFTINSQKIIDNEYSFLNFLLGFFNFREIVFNKNGVMWNFNFQLMGIEKIGMQGQKFDIRVLQLINLIKAIQYNDLEKDISRKGNINIQIDGGMNEDTIIKVKKAGVKRVIIGSYLMNNLNEKEFVEKYKKIKEI